MENGTVPSRCVALLMAALAAMCCAAELPNDSEKPHVNFSKPDRIRFDHRSLIIDGKPTFIFSGAMHYFRCPPELWKDRLLKLKGAGLNCVETYLAWNLHEPDEPSGPGDFSKLRSMEKIGDFIQTARDLGLHVIIRPGPYICAEVDRGGFPGWLMKHQPAQLRLGHYLRGNCPEMMAWNRHWMLAAAKVVKPHLITNVPVGSTGVILWQIENEYDWNGAGLESEVRADVLRGLAQASIEGGIDVPQFTCETMDKAFREDAFLRSQIFNTTNKYPNFDMTPLIDAIEKVAEYQPESLRGVMELQGGWYSEVGGGLSTGHNAAQISQLTLTSIERGCTLINYYMFYGGSNFGLVGAHTLTQTYDYNAPLREWGAIGERYLAVQAIGRMLKEHGDQLIRSRAAPIEVEGEHQDVSIYLRQSDDGSQFFFVRNSHQTEPRSGTVRMRAADGSAKPLSYDLEEFEAKVLYVRPGVSLNAGKWLPQTAERAVVPTETAHAPVTARVVSIAKEVPSDTWRSLDAGKHLVHAEIFDQRYAHYRVSFELTKAQARSPIALAIRADGGTSPIAAQVNGSDMISSDDGYIALASVAREGTNTAVVLFENAACPKFGPIIEQSQGITEFSIVPLDDRPRPLGKWRFKATADDGVDLAEVQTHFVDDAWQEISANAPVAPNLKQRAVMRATLSVSKEQVETGIILKFEPFNGRGTLFVNGTEVQSNSDGSRPWTVSITGLLHAGDNCVAFVVQRDRGEGPSFNGCTVIPMGRPIKSVQVAPDTIVARGELPANHQRLMLTRYTLEFSLPDTPEASAVPWKLHLDADANGFLFLNGHALGRYWAVGPQREIWLPEPWLKFERGAKNIIEVQAKPTAAAPAGGIIKLAEVRPYP